MGVRLVCNLSHVVQICIALPCSYHNNDVIMSVMTSQITGVSILCFTVCSTDKKHQSVTGLFKGIHRWPMHSPPKGTVTRKMFSSDDVVMLQLLGNVTNLPILLGIAPLMARPCVYMCKIDLCLTTAPTTTRERYAYSLECTVCEFACFMSHVSFFFSKLSVIINAISLSCLLK